MSRIIRVIIQNSLYQNKNREDVKNREIRYLPDLSIVNLLSVLVQRILNYYPNYPTHRLYFGEFKTPYVRVFNTTCLFVKKNYASTEMVNFRILESTQKSSLAKVN